jgi:hypothetical protein
MEKILLLLIVIAVLLFVIAGRSRHPTKLSGLAAILSRRCPHCRVVINHRATHCPHCQQETGWRDASRRDAPNNWDKLKAKKWSAAVALLIVGLSAMQANAAEMPKHLTGQWCQTREWSDQYGKGGDFIKAKNVCKEARPVVYDIHQVGFWIKLAGVQARIMCGPLKVEIWAHGWSVVADCGADDLSTPVYRSEFTFEFGRDQDKMAISLRTAK